MFGIFIGRIGALAKHAAAVILAGLTTDDGSQVLTSDDGLTALTED